MPARAEHVSIRGSQGVDLDARLELPAVPPIAFAILAHRFGSVESGPDAPPTETFAASRIATELNAAGFGVLLLDVTDPGSTNDDVRLAAEWLAEHRRGPQLLVGHSNGGAAVLAVAAQIPSARAVATIGAPSSEPGGEPLTARVESMRRALLVLHSPIDNHVGVEHAAALFAAARHPKSYVGLDRADHVLSRDDDAVFAAQMIAAWARRFVVDESGQAPRPAPTAQVVVAETTQGTFLNHVVSGEHHFLADEPTAAGGFDAGPSPYDLLAAALGACTSMTLRLYADRKGWPVDRITVEVAHAKVHAADCEECAATEGTAPTGLVDRFERRLVIDGVLDDEQRDHMLHIADRCPVHRTLEARSTIVTHLA